MENIQIFKNSQFGEVRIFIQENGEPLFVARDVAERLGYSNPLKAIRDHCKGVNETFIPTKGGFQKVRCIGESDMYRLIMRSKIGKAEEFQDWVTSEVLPSIRKTGAYSAPADPLSLLKLAVSEMEKKDKAIAQLKPKAAFADRVLDCNQKVDIGMCAKLLSLPFGRNTLFKELRGRGVFFHNRNEPKQTYINRGYFELKEKFIERDNHDSFVVVKVLVTQKGLAFLSRMFEAPQKNTAVSKIA